MKKNKDINHHLCFFLESLRIHFDQSVHQLHLFSFLLFLRHFGRAVDLFVCWSVGERWHGIREDCTML